MIIQNQNDPMTDMAYLNATINYSEDASDNEKRTSIT